MSLQKAEALYFDTFVSILADCSEELLDKALALCANFDASLSRFKPNSDVSRLNRADGDWIFLGEDAQHVLAEALLISEQTNGAFDVSVGVSSELWSFSGEKAVPDTEKLHGASQRIDYRQIELRGAAARLSAGQRIDLGGIAKGYIADRLLDYMKKERAQCALVNVGGDIAAFGQKPDGERWKVGLQRPFGELDKELWASLDIENEAVVTSGIDRRGFKCGGSWAHHILDPRNGEPVKNDLLAVTVSCGSAMRADALATAFFVLGEKVGCDAAKKLGVGAIFLKKSGEAVCTPNMAARLCLIKPVQQI